MNCLVKRGITRRKSSPLIHGIRLACLLVWATLTPAFAQKDDIRLDTLTVGGQTYTNVVVQNRTETDVYIRHSRGFLNLKVADLSTEVQVQLGYPAPEPPKPSPLEGKMQEWSEKIREGKADEYVQKVGERYGFDVEKIRSTEVTNTTLIIVGAVALVFYLFYSWCLFAICQKVGMQPNLLVWLPILQSIPAHQAAGISPWLILLYLIPVANLIVFIYWAVKLCKARKKSGWLALLNFIPPLNFFFLPVLAFSK